MRHSIILSLFFCLSAFAGDDLPRMVPYYPAEIKGKWGYIDEKSEIILEPQFDFAGPTFTGYSCVGKLFDGEMKYAALSRSKMEPQTAFVYDTVISKNNWRQAALIVRQNDKWFFLHGDSSLFDSIGDGSVTIWAVKLNGKWGFINSFAGQSANFFIEPQFEDVRGIYRDRLFPVKKNGKWGIIRDTGDTAIPFEYEDIGDFVTTAIAADGYTYIHNWFVSAKSKGKWGIIDSTGKWIVGPKIDYIGEFGEVWKESVAPAKKNGKYGYINPKGAWLFPAKYDSALTHQRGRAAVMLDGKWGFIDEQGKLAIPAVYDEITPWYFDHKWAYVRKDNTWQYIDQDGNVMWSQAGKL